MLFNLKKSIFIFFILSGLYSFSQKFSKEINFYDSQDKLFKIERLYQINPFVKLYCSYDGVNMIFKQEEKLGDTVIVSIGKLILGDTSICQCVLKPKLDMANKNLIPEIDYQISPINNFHINKDDSAIELKRKNLEIFRQYSDINDNYLSVLKLYEKQIYRKDKLVIIEEFQDNKKSQTTELAYSTLGIHARKINLSTSSLECEIELNWDKSKNKASIIERRKVLGSFVTNMTSNLISENTITSIDNQGKSEKLLYYNKFDPIKILSYELLQRLQVESMFIDRIENNHIYSYENNLTGSKIVLENFKLNGKHIITALNSTSGSFNQVARIEIENYYKKTETYSNSNLAYLNKAKIQIEE
ncbi:MAG: hypothetical protein ACOVP5_04445 [Chitinophagales bacterium]